MKYSPLAPLPDEIEALYHLFTPRRLKKTDLRSIEWERLADWMQDALTYVGGKDDFRELLPRFFELAWQDAVAGHGLDCTPLWCITLLPSWPLYERESVEACFMLLWRLALHNEDSMGVDEMLETLQKAEVSWVPFLDAWLDSKTSTSVLAQAFSLSLWENMSPDARRWLSQEAVMARVQADFLAASNDEELTSISEFEQYVAFYCAPS